MIPADVERELLEGVKRGGAHRERALEDLIERTYRPMTQVCTKVAGGREAAEDAVQDTYAAVLRSIDRFRGESKLTTWIYRIAVREALRSTRRGRTNEALPESSADPGRSPDQRVADRDGARRLLEAIAELPAHLRVVVALGGLEQLPRAEVAEILGIPVGTVHSRLNEARARLRRRLGLPEAPN